MIRLHALCAVALVAIATMGAAFGQGLPPAKATIGVCDGRFERLLKGYWIGPGELDHFLQNETLRTDCLKSLKSADIAEHLFVEAFILEHPPRPDAQRARELYGEACGWHLDAACFHAARLQPSPDARQDGARTVERLQALSIRLPALSGYLGAAFDGQLPGAPFDPERAERLLQDASEQGDYWATMHLAMRAPMQHPEQSSGAKADKNFLRRAAEQGNTEARLLLAHRLAEDGDWTASAATMRQAAESDPKFFRSAVGEARFWMGYYHGEGLGVPRDDNETTRWYRAAAELGNEIARGKLNPK